MRKTDTMQLEPIHHVDVGALTWHGIAGSTFIAAFLDMLPTTLTILGLLAAFILYSIKIFESRTFQHWYNNHRMQRAAKKLAKLKAQELKQQAIIDAGALVSEARTEARHVLEVATEEAARVLAHAPVATAETVNKGK